MSAEECKSNIQGALKAFAKGNLTKNSLELFEKLGYITSRRAPLDKPTFEEFKDTYIAEQRFDEAKARVKEWEYIDLLFQLSKEEISHQINLFDTKQVDKTIIETYLFFTIGLRGLEYNRTDLSNITREINRLFPMPVMVLLKYGENLTLSVINRRLNKRDETKDILEKVTLIKDISIENPLRAHIEILFDLSFTQLLEKYQFTNFVELHNAWQETLDTEELNKRFYKELFNWYLWAVQSVCFPNDAINCKEEKGCNAESVIRLITRLIFVWFIKEKKLVPETLFNVKKLKTILKGFDPESEKTSVYYSAILQNLFFATLNTPMDKDITDENKNEKRRFVNILPEGGIDDYLDQTKYRYQDYFINPDNALELFASIPFLNGGLFECLDFKDGSKEIRYDGFINTESKQAFIPDKLFFANEFTLDLNAAYGTKDQKYRVEGLINILDSYKFTIAENTPIEEEIALDPELLGKVFENLLASYNPETQTTARKQTGSFYTPREIVNYMVDESLIAYFKQKLEDSREFEYRLRELFSHTTDIPKFSKEENRALIKAISEVKILDPACGSGAFPMGVLHRMVDLLKKLDPENKEWSELQIQRAINETSEVFKLEKDSEERIIRLNEIERAFDLNMNHPDYARKLFLIENCIYGVDIQQIAIQISKLRFFISLIVDQKVNDDKPNRNILSMPNLETKFVAANTLVGLNKPLQMRLITGEVEQFERELASIRHKIFFTRKYSAKKELKQKEKEKREELKQALICSGFGEDTATQIALWNPFDPMHSANFFNPETMFGFSGRFDIVIGNPPYVVTRRGAYNNYSWEGDLYTMFFELAVKKLLKSKGILSFITPRFFLFNQNNYDMRKIILNELNIILMVECNPFDAVTENEITVLTNEKTKFDKIDFYIHENESIQYLNTVEKEWIRKNNLLEINPYLTEEVFSVLEKIKGEHALLSKISRSKRGAEIGKAELRDGAQGKPILLGYDVNRYCITPTNAKIDTGHKEYKRLINYFRQPQLILLRRVAKDVVAAVSEKPIAFSKNLYGITPDNNINPYFLAALLNSSLLNFYYKKKFSTKKQDVFPEIQTYLYEQLPIINIDEHKQDSLISLVHKIIAEKIHNPRADTSIFETQIDEMVYRLYELTEEEIKIIKENA